MDYKTIFDHKIQQGNHGYGLDVKGHLLAVNNLRKWIGLEKDQIYKYLGWNDAPFRPRGKTELSTGLMAVDWCKNMIERLESASERSVIYHASAGGN